MLPLDVIARPFVLPVLLWQAVSVRRAALSLPEADGPRDGEEGQGRALRLLIVGDSSAAGVGVEHQSDALIGQTVRHLKQSFHLRWRLIARTGATVQTTLKRLARDREAKADQFDVAVLVLGVNDAVRLRSLRAWLAQHRALRHKLVSQYGVQHIVVLGVPPLSAFPALTPLLRWILGAHAARMDKALATALREEQGTTYLKIDLPLTAQAMARDGFHPNAQSYAMLGAIISTHITETLG